MGLVVFRVQEAATEDQSTESKWDREPSDSEGEDSATQQKHKEEFKEWRKKHYNEYFAVKRARELIAKVSRMEVGTRGVGKCRAVGM